MPRPKRTLTEDPDSINAYDCDQDRASLHTDDGLLFLCVANRRTNPDNFAGVTFDHGSRPQREGVAKLRDALTKWLETGNL